MNWPALPFVRLILPLVLGMVLGIYFLPFSLKPLALSYGSLLIFLLLLSRSRLPYQYRRWYGLLLFLGLTGLGLFLIHYHTPWQHPRHLRHFTDDAHYWRGEVNTVKAGDRRIRLQVGVSAFSDTSGSVRPATGKLLLYLPADSLATGIHPGMEISFRAEIHALSPPMNPRAFDYAAYMENRGVYHRAFVEKTDWRLLDTPASPWNSGLYRIRTYCLEVLRKHLPAEDALSIGAALIMGERGLIDEDIKEAFTDTGAIHVLAVSGLHVGIIYLSLGWLLGIMGIKGKRWRWPGSLIQILGIWSFAFLTGGSASVLRAASMFSFLILGNALFRRHNIYNTLAASAFLLLCIQPYLLFDVGFQLSYLAVIGIVFFQGRIYRAWYIPGRLGDYLWKLASVSIAAQLTTLPLSLFYFHQFPVYFWLSGWIVVPAAMVILCLGLGLLLLHRSPYLPDLLGYLLETVITTMNQLIISIQQFPLALINGIWLGSGILILLYLVLIQLMRGLRDRRLRPIQWALAGLITIGLWQNVQLWQAAHQTGMTVYHLYGHTAIDIFDGRTAYCLSDLAAEAPPLNMATENHRIYHRIKDHRHFPLSDTSFQSGNFALRGQFFRIGEISGYLLDALPKRAPPSPLALDYLIIRNNANLKIEQLSPYFRPGHILLDASSYPSKCNEWAADCKKLGIPCHDIGQAGAWVRIQ